MPALRHAQRAGDGGAECPLDHFPPNDGRSLQPGEVGGNLAHGPFLEVRFPAFRRNPLAVFPAFYRVRVEVVNSPVDSFQGFRQRGENSPRVLAALAASDRFFAHGLIFRLVAAYLAGDKGKHGPQAVEEVFHQFALRAAFGVNMADAEAVQQPLDAVAFPDAALKHEGIENADVPARPYHGPGDVLSAVRLLVADDVGVGGNEAGGVVVAGQKLEASQPDAVFFRALVAGPSPGPGNAHAEVDRRVVPGRALSGPQEASVQIPT